MPDSTVTEPTRLAVHIDLDAPGRSLGYVGIIHSDGSSVEYGVVPVPIAVFNNGDGPTVLLTAGTHGDEYEGQVVLHRLVRTLDIGQVRGSLIVMPALNLPAVLAEARCSSLDGENLNRAYPGDRNGGPTAQIADFVTRYLLPRCDFAADLHSGGKSTEFVPCGFMTRMPHGRNSAAQAAAMEAFGMPWTVVYDESTEDRALDTACDRNDVVMVSSELGGAGTVTHDILRAAEAGLPRMLAHWGVLDADPTPTPGTTFLDVNGKDSHVMAHQAGLVEPAVNLGDAVNAGDVVAWLHPATDLAAAPIPLRADMSGVIYQRRVPPLVQHGSIVFSIATEITREEI